MPAAPLLEIENLAIGFTGRDGRQVEIVAGLSLDLAAGESLGIVGESACGKSTALLAMLGFLKPGLSHLAGSVRFAGQDLFALPARSLEKIRGGRIGFVPQNAGQSLTPTLRLGQVLEEALALHSAIPAAGRRQRALELLAAVQFPEPAALLSRYPHQLSGGQQQRIAIALALAGEPELLLLDEPTTALDVTTRAHVLEVLHELGRGRGLAMVYVSHDLGVIAHMARRIAVMYAGELVEEGPTAEILRRPGHPYARGLLASIPRLRRGGLPAAMPGQLPALGGGRQGCAFAPRCPLAEERCRQLRPALQSGGGERRLSCHRVAESLALELPPPSPRPATAAGATASRLLEIERLNITYARPGPLARLRHRSGAGRAPAPPTVRDLDLTMAPGEVLALVGESGSGKSTVLRVLSGLLPALSGRALLAGGERGSEDVAGPARERSQALLKQVQIIFQNPDESLNPRQTVAEILGRPLRLYFRLPAAEVERRSRALLEAVRLAPAHLDRFPGQLSGGEKQRVAIARGFAAEPRLLLCDEVTSALDVSVQAAVLDLLLRLKSEQGAALLFVSHDLAVVRAISDRVAILFRGELCEIGRAEEVYAPPTHPYTEALLSACLEPEPGAIADMILSDAGASQPRPDGCPFAGRCHRRIGPICEAAAPPWRRLSPTHALRCHLTAEALAPAGPGAVRQPGEPG
jgi:peptide/nickel transport system ATP-binding protein